MEAGEIGEGRPHLDDVVGSGDLEGLSTSEDIRGDNKGLGSEHFALLSCGGGG